jgi:hypothetical protein
MKDVGGTHVGRMIAIADTITRKLFSGVDFYGDIRGALETKPK